MSLSSWPVRHLYNGLGPRFDPVSMTRYLNQKQCMGQSGLFSIQLQVAVHHCEDTKAGTSASHTTSSQVNADMLIQLLIVFNQILYTQFSIPSLGNDTTHSGTDLSELIMENKKILYGHPCWSVWWRSSFIEELFQGDYRLCQIDN